MEALGRHLPAVAARIPWVPLGDWPTPLEPLIVDGARHDALWIKREGASSAHYGGNKVRTLEPWFGVARARGAERIWAIGAYGSNHAVATAIHAPRVGLAAGAIVFPQPTSPWAVENAGALVAAGCPLVRLRSVVEVPFVGGAIALRDPHALVMPPGGATVIGTMGCLAAAFELAEQVAAGLAPSPRRIVVPIGSACTIAGLVCGLALAAHTGAWRGAVPIVHGVRVTPWPVTSAVRIAELARATLARIAALGGPSLDLGWRALLRRFVVDRTEFGAGYGQVTARGASAMARVPAPRLDGVYTGKAMAALLRLHAAQAGPLLFWSTKSETVLPPPTAAALARAPRALLAWLATSAR